MHRVNEVLFDENKHASGIRIWPRNTNSAEASFTVHSRKEVIMTAGALHSPQILQRSGIGSRDLLESAGIETKVYVYSAHREWNALRAQGMVGGVVVIVKVVSYTYFVTSHLPGVGSNLQDHPSSRTSFNCESRERCSLFSH